MELDLGAYTRKPNYTSLEVILNGIAFIILLTVKYTRLGLIMQLVLSDRLKRWITSGTLSVSGFLNKKYSKVLKKKLFRTFRDTQIPRLFERYGRDATLVNYLGLCAGNGKVWHNAFSFANNRLIYGPYGIDVEFDKRTLQSGKKYLQMTFIHPITLEKFPESHFEAVVIINSLHLINDPHSIFIEIYRVLKPGGTLYFMEQVGYPRGTVALIVQKMMSLVWEHFFVARSFAADWKNVMKEYFFIDEYCTRYATGAPFIIRPYAYGYATKKR